MTVLIVIESGEQVELTLPALHVSASSMGSTIMELDWPNPPELSATELRATFTPDMMLRDIAVSDADMLAWGRALPRSPGLADMIDLDI